MPLIRWPFQLHRLIAGPSAQNVHTISIVQEGAVSSRVLTFYGAVLHLRGDVVTLQPHIAKTGNVLLWNGEIFDGIFVDHHQNDGQEIGRAHV